MYSLTPQFLFCEVPPDATIEAVLEDAVMIAFTSTYAVRFTYEGMVIQINHKSVAKLFTEGRPAVNRRILAQYRTAVAVRATELTI